MSGADTQEQGTAKVWRRAWWRRALQRALTSLHIVCYRATGGAIGHRIGPLPNLLLTTTGRRSGKPRTQVLTYLRVEGLLALVASNFGSRTPPLWYRNLEAHPEATVQLKRERWSVRSRLATPEEHARIWSAALLIWPAWSTYAKRARRPIPIVVLEPASGGASSAGT
jgi:deazaflavin-dependent oxidoreductase (nitroreductase family)